MQNQNQTTIKSLSTMIHKKPLIISGPCSAETEEQVIEGAKQLAATGKVDIYRAGIWKPRTKPGMFEGVGKEGLPWLQKAKAITGLPMAVEVATAKQVEEALAHDIDVLWIGARSTVNPFSVQEIADSLQGVDLPVLVKNPINADLELWSGAIERLQRAGLTDLGLIHRGFSSYGNTMYRNAPMWHLAIDMKLRYPNMPMINDPSHICGKRSTLQNVMQKAIDLNYDGLMVESHINPEKAWSDANQQITPAVLKEMLEQINWRNEDIDSDTLHNALNALRQKINQIDDEIMLLHNNRMKIAREIGQYKKDNNITVLQSSRWNEIIDKAIKEGEKYNLSKKFITTYYDAIHIESINQQKEVMDDKK